MKLVLVTYTWQYYTYSHNAIDYLVIAHTIALTGFRQVVRSVGHALHSAGDNYINLTSANA